MCRAEKKEVLEQGPEANTVGHTGPEPASCGSIFSTLLGSAEAVSMLSWRQPDFHRQCLHL